MKRVRAWLRSPLPVSRGVALAWVVFLGSAHWLGALMAAHPAAVQVSFWVAEGLLVLVAARLVWLSRGQHRAVAAERDRHLRAVQTAWVRFLLRIRPPG